MVPSIIAMIMILALAVGVLGMVVVGMEGQGRWRLPAVASRLAKAGEHLNGEAEPPRGLIVLFEEAEEGADDLRQLPSTLRSRGTARSGGGTSDTGRKATWAAPEIAATFGATDGDSSSSAWGVPEAPELEPAPASWQPAQAAPAASSSAWSTGSTAVQPQSEPEAPRTSGDAWAVWSND